MSADSTTPDDACGSRRAGGRAGDLSALGRLTVEQVAAWLATLGPEDEAAWAAAEADVRVAVRRLAIQRRRALAQQAAVRLRHEEMLRFEKRFWAQGVARVAGVDEVGRGCLAGPVVAAAVVLPGDARIWGLDDSKRLSAGRREELAVRIRAQALGIGIGQMRAEQIDRLGILQATLAAMRAALAQLPSPPGAVLVDGPHVPGSGLTEVPIIDGDARSLSVAAASVVAKVYRDGLMTALAVRYPQYGFERHKGYGTSAHLAALRCHGPCPLHRRSFAGVVGPADEGLGGQAPRTPTGRRAAAAAGVCGEELAARHLRARGGEVLARRYRAAGGEIDLIVRDGPEIVFVEVKATAGRGLGWPAARVDAAKRARMAQAARHYLARQPGEPPCRFDVIVVELDASPPRVQHLPDAWRP